MNREKARELATALVDKMTLEEMASQLRFDAPAIDRLGVAEYNWWSEGLHGVARAGSATVFPQAIGMAASWDDELIEKEAEVISTEARAKYNAYTSEGDRDIYKGLTLWSPNVNIFRDPRWGRGHETLGEDPYLTSRLGVAFVKGLQGNGEVRKIGACAKHFAVHSGPEAIRHSFDARSDMKDMWETYLPAFETLVVEGDVESVMGAYNRTNGEPCCGHSYLMEDVLRKLWKFEGHFVSDCWAIRDFHENHKVTSSPEESAALALKKGCDLNCGCTYRSILEAYDKGLIDKEDIRTAAIRLFTTRYLLGEFEENEYDKIPYEAVECKEHLAIARKAAEKTIVMLKNDNCLPLNKEALKTIAVIGPNADSRKALMGNYHGTASRYTTVLEGIQDYVGDDVRVLYSLGSHLFLDKEEPLAKENDRIAEAIVVAKHSDVVVLCLGLDETLEGEEGDTGNSYASGDKKDLMLPPCQQRLLEAVLKVGKPVIVCMMAGSSIDMSVATDKAAAILQCWYPGAQGGKTVADILFGEVSPSGKLPLTFYHNEDLDKMPAFEDYAMKGRTYRYFKDEPLYPFGFGLTYADVKIKNASINIDLSKLATEVSSATANADARTAYEVFMKNSVTAKVELTNSSSKDTDEVIQVYVKTDSRFEPDNGKLAAYKRVHVAAGQTITVDIDIPVMAWTVVDDNGKRFIDGNKAVVTFSLNGINKCTANNNGAGFIETEV
ncbi:MAG: glycoside hydrolase family 3 C-terminal domain-containing protein [Lachnospiraceae bacterium]|nr:glycoside hydrolase family 3 C-terminal domain-containing protein [Lachnospiraceae bacterium]